VHFRGSCARIVQGQQLRRDKRRIKTIRNEIRADRRRDKPDRVQPFPALESDFAEGAGTEEREARLNNH